MAEPVIVELADELGDELVEDLVEDAVRLWEATGLTRPWNDPRADLARAMNGPSSAVLAALAGGDGDAALLGTVLVGHDGHRGWVYYLAVDPVRRGEGLGRVLMAAAETWLAGRGVPKIQLMVRATNTPVVAFYERLGYADQECVVLGKFFDDSLQGARAAAH